MELLKGMTLPLVGELNDVYLLHLGIDPAEIRAYMPECMPLKLVGGRAIMSLVNVRASAFRLRGMPRWMGIEYRAIMFRVLVDDSRYNPDGVSRGIHIPHIFLNNTLVSAAFGLVTDQHTSVGSVVTDERGLRLTANGRSLSYRLDPDAPAEPVPEQQEIADVLDRAYTVSKQGTVRRISIAREKWPLKSMACTHFETDFFESAEPLCLFKVTETIPYEWTAFQRIDRVSPQQTQRALLPTGAR